MKVICVLEYPESGDQASVRFMDLDVLEASTDPDAKRYAKVIRKAMADKMKITGHNEYIDNLPGVESCEVNLPCVVEDQVTIYVD